MRVNLLTCYGFFAQLDNFLLPELGVVVDVDLCIDAEQLVLRVGSPWIDLHLSGIELAEHLVEFADLVFSLILLLLEVERLDEAIEVYILEALIDIDRDNHNRVRVGLSDLLDLHTTVLAGHYSWLLRVAI